MDKLKLKDCIILLKNGATIKQFEKAKGIPITRIETLSNNQFNRDKLGYANISSSSDFEDYVLDDGDILISHINSREFLGRAVRYSKIDGEVIIHGMNVLRLKTNPVVLDSYYAYYMFQTQYYKKSIQSIRKDAINQSSIAISDLANIAFDIPRLDVQLKTISILKLIDRKIALNQEINRNLEALARQLYDYWFVQFDFPDENGRPYKSSGGKMVWNEKLKREIPEGWMTLTLSEVEPNVITGKTPSTADERNFGGTIPFITIDDIRQYLFVYKTVRTLTVKGADSQVNKYLPAGSLCCSCIGTVGVLGFVGRIGQTNQQVNSIIFSDQRNKEFLYFSLQLHFSHANAKVGNILPNMSKDEFCRIPVLYPTKDLLSKYHTQVKYIFAQIDIRIKQIIDLTKQRDELLPLLMNGQVNCDLSAD